MVTLSDAADPFALVAAVVGAATGLVACESVATVAAVGVVPAAVVFGAPDVAVS